MSDLADSIESAYANRQSIPTPSSAPGGLDLPTAYLVEAELTRRRRAAGRVTVGRKVGYANRAMWRALKIDTLVWARMYDDTVQYTTAPPALSAVEGSAAEGSLAVAGRHVPKIEPEVVFKLRSPVPREADAAAILGCVQWMALGFEIIDCVFPDWKFQPADFVAAYGLHSALVVGTPARIEPAGIPAIAEALATFTLTLSRNGAQVEEGAGKNSLKSPALCLGELAAAIARQPGAEPLAAGEIVSTGTLTTPQPIAAGDIWRADVRGLDLPPLTLTVI